jgi:hypothetical protein
MRLLVLFALVDIGQRPAPTDKEMKKKENAFIGSVCSCRHRSETGANRQRNEEERLFLLLPFALEEIKICE